MYDMNVFTRAISKIFKDAAKAFQTFPAAIACALAFAIVTMIRIQMDWPQQEAYNFLFNSLHWAFALGAIFSLAVITAAQSRYNESKAFLLANLLGGCAAVVTFLALYWFGGTDPASTEYRYTMLSGLAAARVGVAILVSFIAFIILVSYPKEQSDVAHALFMILKSFFIALTYGIVIMSGTSGVAGAVEALLYQGMSEKVYMYIATFSGFLAFCIFAGYFPDFRKGKVDQHREDAQKQPRFIEILFEYILIPIVLALTVVLLLWATKTVMGGMRVPFLQLSSIATAYTVGGILLHVLVSHHDSGLAKFYRRFYPLAALIILAFEAWALIIQLQKTGLKMDSYSFIVIWIIALVSVVLLLLRQAKAHVAIAYLISTMAIISVLPVVSYQALPVTVQVNRLETLLLSQNMLKDNQIIPAADEPGETVKQSITDAVNYLAYAEDAKLPVWFDKDLRESATFKSKMGFEQTWPKPDDLYPGRPMGTSLLLPPEAIDISGYRWAFDMQTLAENSQKGGASSTVNGERGTYRITWIVDFRVGIPTLKIELNDQTILEQDMNPYIDRITKKFPPGKTVPPEAALEDMSLQLATPEVTALLVFRNIDISSDPYADTIHYYLNLSAIYLKENP